jgi:hypothetical protein
LSNIPVPVFPQQQKFLGEFLQKILVRSGSGPFLKVCSEFEQTIKTATLASLRPKLRLLCRFCF